MKNYHPQKVSCSLGGLLIASGWAEDEFITLEWEADAVTDVVGVDGEVSASVSNDARSTLTLKLMHTSDENQKLEQLYNLRKRGGGSVGVFPVLLRDNETGETVSSPDAYLMRPPDISYGAQASAREWKVRLTNTELKYG
jgi:hypothetical protein